jgi:putative transposase
MRKRPAPEQIAKILRQFQADLDSGLNINHACRKAGICTTTDYRWKALQEDPISNEQLRVSELEAENGRLKALVAELALDRKMLQEALKKTTTRQTARKQHFPKKDASCLFVKTLENGRLASADIKTTCDPRDFS